MRRFAVIGLLCCAVFGTVDIAGDQRLTLRVSPAVALAPALLTVRASIEPDDANRALTIAVSSASYTRTSEIALDGKSSQRVSVFELRDVPAGLYEVKATLVGSHGHIATAMQLAKVQPAPGYMH